MKEMKIEAKITRKNRLCWTLVFFGAIILGILFYGLSGGFGLTAVFITIIFSTIFYTTACELVTKTFDMFWFRSTFIFPLGSVITYVINFLSPKYTYTLEDPHGYSFTFLLYVILLVLCFFSSSVGTLITRLVSGYEALAEEPAVASYLMEGKTVEIVALLKNFLDSLNIEYTTIIMKSDNFIKFQDGTNTYFLFSHPKDDTSVEVDFVVSSIKRETLVEPSKEDLEVLIAYLETFLGISKDGKITKWTTKFEAKNAEPTKIRVWESLTSPLQIRERLALRGVITQKAVTFFVRHKTAILTFVGGILTVIIGELLLNYLIKTLGI
jgi:hypothetical protein